MSSKYTVIAIISIFILGVLLLYALGGSLISEVTKDVTIEDRGQIIFAAIDKPAPYFELPNLDGEIVTSSDFLGMPLILVFWTTWNSASADQIKIADDYLPRAESRGLFKIIAISSQEDKSVVNNFIHRGGYSIPVLLDESGEVGEKYQARSLPATYFIDKNGVFREVFIGILSEKQIAEKAEILL